MTVRELENSSMYVFTCRGEGQDTICNLATAVASMFTRRLVCLLLARYCRTAPPIRKVRLPFEILLAECDIASLSLLKAPDTKISPLRAVMSVSLPNAAQPAAHAGDKTSEKWHNSVCIRAMRMPGSSTQTIARPSSSPLLPRCLEAVGAHKSVTDTSPMSKLLCGGTSLIFSSTEIAPPTPPVPRSRAARRMVTAGTASPQQPHVILPWAPTLGRLEVQGSRCG